MNAYIRGIVKDHVMNALFKSDISRYGLIHERTSSSYDIEEMSFREFSITNKMQGEWIKFNNALINSLPAELQDKYKDHIEGYDLGRYPFGNFIDEVYKVFIA